MEPQSLVKASLTSPCSCKKEKARKTGSHSNCDNASPFVIRTRRGGPHPLMNRKAVGNSSLKTSPSIRKENADSNWSSLLTSVSSALAHLPETVWDWNVAFPSVARDPTGLFSCLYLMTVGPTAWLPVAGRDFSDSH